jgi:hypothetical protein
MPAQEKKVVEYYKTQDGGNYRVHVGPRGGKYINVKGVKRYI